MASGGEMRAAMQSGAIAAGDEGSRRAMLKHLMQQLEQGALPAQVEAQLKRLLGQVPHARVVEVEQELLAEGLPPTSELARLCHLHGEAVRGALPVVSSAPSAPAVDSGPARPPWVDTARVTARLDARPLLARGEHPVAQIMAALAALEASALFELVTPFAPEPLLDRARAAGYILHTEAGADGQVRTWFARGGLP